MIAAISSANCPCQRTTDRPTYRCAGHSEDLEVVLIVKTRRELVDELSARVADIHSYDNSVLWRFRLKADTRRFRVDWGGDATYRFGWTSVCAGLVLVISGRQRLLRTSERNHVK